MQPGRLPAQPAVQSQLGVQCQFAVPQAAFAAQRTGQATRQLGEPVGRIETVELQRRLPGDAIGEAEVQLPFGVTLPGHQAQ